MATLPLQNFQDFIGPVVSAAWLNSVDQLTFGNAFRYGVSPTGGDISASLQAALNSTSFVWLPPSTNGSVYTLHDVTIPSGCTLFAPGVSVQDTAGSQFVVKCVGTSPGIIGLNIASALNSPNAIVVDDAVGCHVDNITINNAQVCMLLKSSSNGGNGTGCTNTRLSHIIGKNFSSTGLAIQPNCSNTQLANMLFDAVLTAGTGGQIPKVGTVGYSLTSTGSVVNAGGHQWTNCIGQNMQSSFVFMDASQVLLTNCSGLALSGGGFNLAGATSGIDIVNGLVVNSGNAIDCAATASSNKITSIRTVNVGVIPAGGGTNWYTSVGFTPPFFDLVQVGTTAFFSINIDSWISSGANAYAISEGQIGNIRMTGGWVINLNTLNTVPAGTTTFIAISGVSAVGGASIIVPFNCLAFIKRISIGSGAPGAGQTFTYTLFKNGVATSITGVTSGAGQFSPTLSGGPVTFNAGDVLSLQLITSAGAAAQLHQAQLQLIQLAS